MTDTDSDWRSIGQVVADADRRLAEALAAKTGSDAEVWLAAISRGVPFREVSRRAHAQVGHRVRAFRDRKK